MHLGVMSKTRENAYFPVWVRQRELGQRLPLGHSDEFYKSLYSSISRCYSWSGEETSRIEPSRLHNLEFSPDGKLLVAGSENSSFLMFDPLSRRLIRTVHKAHASGVTQIKFLDSRIFATGCIDGTVSLWDSRNINSRYQTLVGHSSMVGNIEFSRKNDLLITSGLDGYTFIWDINNCNERGEFTKDILESHPFIRLRLNLDETKMILTTAIGCLVIVQELELDKIAQDLKELEKTLVNPYTLQAMNIWGIDSSRVLTPNRRRNRVEIVADFPNPDDFYVFSALEIHPQGWTVFSRKMQYDKSFCSITNSRDRDCTYVHDIQEKEPSGGGAAARRGSRDDSPPCPQRMESNHEDRCSGARERRERSGSPGDTARPRSPPSGPPSASLPQELAGSESSPASSRLQDPSIPRPNSRVGQFNHFPRLTHFFDVPFVRGRHIQSLSVSADGRLVCSPLERRIRFLAFSPECSEQSVSCGTYPRRLHELRTGTFQTEGVFCTKFSPRDCLLVSGCSDGKLAWYQPVV